MDRRSTNNSCNPLASDGCWRSVAVLGLLLLISATLCFANDKPVAFVTIPPGAKVEVNGSVVCTTPCSIQVPEEYFGPKDWLISRHAKNPITVRLIKEGCAPKHVNITVKFHWRNGIGIGYTFYEVTAKRFAIHLDAPQSERNLSESNEAPTCNVGESREIDNMLHDAQSALVILSGGKERAIGFLISPDGLIVTDSYLINDHRTVTVTFSDGHTVKTSKTYLDLDRGLGLVKAAGAGFPYLQLSKSEPKPGDDVFVAESPSPKKSSDADSNRAIVGASYDNDQPYLSTWLKLWPWTTDLGSWVEVDRALPVVTPGVPLLNRDGEVVGIATRQEIKASQDQGIWTGTPDIEEFVVSHFVFKRPTPSPHP